MKNRIWGLSLLALSAFSWVCGPAGAKEISFDAAYKSVYDSNVYEYSDQDQGEFKNTIQTTPAKFGGTESLDDWVNSFSFNPEFSMNILPSGETTLGSDIDVNLYAHNENKNYQEYDMYVKQYFGRKDLLKAGYINLPHFFVRTEFGETKPRRYRKATFQNNAFYLKYWHRFNKKVSGWIRYSHEDKNYNADFNERDTISNTVQMSLSVQPQRWVEIRPFYWIALDDARGNVSSITGTSPNISKEEYRLGAEITLYPVKHLSISTEYSLEWGNYLTDTDYVYDPNHSGRDDETQRIGLNAVYQWNKSTKIVLDYRYTIRDVSFKNVRLAQQSLLGYDRHVTSVGVVVSW